MPNVTVTVRSRKLVFGSILVALCMAFIALLQKSKPGPPPVIYPVVHFSGKESHPAILKTSPALDEAKASNLASNNESPTMHKNSFRKVSALTLSNLSNSVLSNQNADDPQFKELKSKLKAIEYENLELIVDLKRGETKPTVYVFHSPSDEQSRRISGLYSQFASSIEGSDKDQLKALAIELVNTYLDFPASYKIVTTVTDINTDKVTIMEGFADNISELDKGGYNDMIYSYMKYSVVSSRD